MSDAQAATRDHIAQLVADLRRPEAYPESVESVTLAETHISLAFLAGEHVYKIKKPVDFGFLDFSTLERRQFFCHEEVRLNRRLTDDVYLKVVPVVEVDGRLQLFGDGPAVEYAVKMRRLRDDRTLAHLLKTDQVEDHTLVALAERLARFYGEAATGPGVDEWGTADAVWVNVKENLDQTVPYVGTVIAPIQHRLIDEVSREFLEQEATLFAKRLESGMIREGHGDLHLAHIYVEGPRPEDLQILDGVEFNPRLRCGDIAVDVAFLAMDLDYHGRPDLAQRVVRLLAERLGDADLERLVQFFSIYRAHVRNKVACFRVDELPPEQKEFQTVRAEAERYIDQATSYIVEPERPTLFLVAGLSGTGKTLVADRLGRSIGAMRASADVVRKELAGRAPESREKVSYGAGIYSQEHTERTYETLLARAAESLTAGRSAVLDATFLDPQWRERAREVAAKSGAELVLIECQCPADVVQQRLADRAEMLNEPSDADWTIYQQQRERWGDSLGAIEGLPAIVVTTDRPSAQVLDTVLSGIPLRRRL